MFIRRSGAFWAMAALIGVSQTTAWALEQWPDQPVRLPYLGPPPHDWPNDPLLGLWSFNRRRVGLGGIFKVPVFGGVFFSTEADLELFEKNSRRMGQSAHILHSGDTLFALEDISANSAGGRVFSQKYGQGFAVWSTSTSDYLVQSRPVITSHPNRFHRFAKSHQRLPANATTPLRGTTTPR